MAKTQKARAGKARRQTEANNSSVYYLAELRRKERREREISKLIGRLRKIVERNEDELHALGAWLMVRTAERTPGAPAAADAGAGAARAGDGLPTARQAYRDSVRP